MKGNNKFGLRSDDLITIMAILTDYPAVNTALIFGSRAKGNNKPGSDVDIALRGKGVTNRMALDIAYRLNEETIMPYHFDVLNYHTITNPDLVAHIDRIGQVFYTTQTKTQEKTQKAQLTLGKPYGMD